MDEPAIVAKPGFDATVVEDCQSNGCLADPTSAKESEWGEVFRKTDDVLDQLVPAEEDPWRRWRRYPV